MSTHIRASEEPWEPGTDDPDSADGADELLAALPAHQRAAAAMLLDLPDDYPVPFPGHSLAEVSAGRLFVMLCSGRLPANQIVQYLRAHRLVRPGLAENHNPNREEPTMTGPTQTITFFAVVGANTHHPGEPCGHDGCRAAAQFTVACADDSGALVADASVPACAEHLAAQVREACDY